MLNKNNNEQQIALKGYRKIHRSDSIGWIIGYSFCLFLVIISLARLTVVGQFFDDVLFTFCFGIFKYLAYFILLILSILGLCKYPIIVHYKIKLLLFYFIIVSAVFVGNIILIYDYYHNSSVNIKIISGNIFTVVIKDFLSNWYNHSLFTAHNVNFFNFNGSWFSIYNAGGFFGQIILGILSYLTIFGPLIIIAINYLFIISLLLTGHIFGLFVRDSEKNGLRIIRINKHNEIKQRVFFKRQKEKNHYDLDKTFLLYQIQHADPDVGVFISRPANFDNAIKEHFKDEDIEQISPTIKVPPSARTKPQQQTKSVLMSREELEKLSIKELNAKYQEKNPDEKSKIEKSFNSENKKNYYIPQTWTAKKEQKKAKKIKEANYRRAKIIENSQIRPYATPVNAVSANAEILNDKITNQQIEQKSVKTQQLNQIHNLNKRIKKNKKIKRLTPSSQYDYLKNNFELYQKQASLSYEKAAYTLPPISLLKDYTISHEKKEINSRKAQELADIIQNNFEIFNVKANVMNFQVGPSVTKFEIKLVPGAKVNSVTKLSEELKLSLGTHLLRIESPIPGKSLIGIEVANKKNEIVYFKELFTNIPKENKNYNIMIALGKQVDGKKIYFDLTKTPHLLVAGSTGSGKSVCINTIIASIILNCKPHKVKLILIDPKKVELNMFNGLPHLLTKVIYQPKHALHALKQVAFVMKSRYDLISQKKVRNIEEYNKVVPLKDRLPYIVVIIDELADLMNTLGRELEEVIQSITQLARAAGIHMVIATQRPSTDIITGVIKTNIPSRIAFSVANGIDSRTILDTTGAEQLIGKGDMLMQLMMMNSPIRIQGAFIDMKEINNLIRYSSKSQKPDYDETFINLEQQNLDNQIGQSDKDEKYDQIKQYIIQVQRASTSLLQRKFSIGYNRASRIIDALEEEGVIGPQNGSKPREVFIKDQN